MSSPMTGIVKLRSRSGEGQVRVRMVRVRSVSYERATTALTSVTFLSVQLKGFKWTTRRTFYFK